MTELRVILDIDGVLNSNQSKDRILLPDHSKYNDRYRFSLGLSPENVEVLNKLSDAFPEAKIVVSSSWRFCVDKKDLIWCFRASGVKMEIVDFTDFDLRPILPDRYPILMGKERSDEIREYMEAHPEFQYLVLDDDPSISKLGNFAFLCDPKVGLTTNVLNDVLSYLLPSTKDAPPAVLRPSKDEYYMAMAHSVSQRGTCQRLKVGCVIVSPMDEVISTGYNGSPSGEPHCIDVGCMLNDEGRCIRTIHAEENAITRCQNRSSLRGSTAYVTHEPCERCAKTLLNMGIRRVVWTNPYPNKYSSHFLNRMECACVDPFSRHPQSYLSENTEENSMNVYAVVSEYPDRSARRVVFGKTKPDANKLMTAARKHPDFKSGVCNILLYKVPIPSGRSERDSVITTLNTLVSGILDTNAGLLYELLDTATKKSTPETPEEDDR